MTKLIFVTSNTRKIKEASLVLGKSGIEFDAVPVDIYEIQHHDSVEITKEKARSAFEAVHHPVIVQDTSWNIPALGGFPGGYMKDVANWWHAADWMSIMAPHEDRRIICLEHVAYFDGEQLKHFEVSYEGVFVDAPRGCGKSNNSLEQSISLDGKYTFAELHDMNNYASASSTHEHWELFVDWYKKGIKK